MQLFVGVDVHKKLCHATTINEKGDVIQTKVFENNACGLQEFAGSLLPSSKVVVEACSNFMSVYDALESKAIDVVAAHPAKVKLIAESSIKNDMIDSESLARLLRLNSIPKAFIPPKPVREARELVRQRRALVQQLTSVKNKIHALLAYEGVTHNISNLFNKRGMSFLAKVKLSEAGRHNLDDLLKLTEFLKGLIESSSKRIKEVYEEEAECKLLATIPGIGVFSAVAIASEIASIRRFSSHEKLACYAGLVPKLYASGDYTYFGHITKKGSNLLRWVLVQDSYAAVRKSKKVKRFYNRIVRKKGKKIAIVAVARKLVKYVYWVLSNDKEFRENYRKKQMDDA